MAESAAHLVDQVIPRVPLRRWVLSFPIPLRILFATHPGLLSPVLADHLPAYREVSDQASGTQT